MEEREIINRVANSPIVTIDLEDYYHKGERLSYDIAQHLYQGLILKEKDFRAFVKDHDWSQYKEKNTELRCIRGNYYLYEITHKWDKEKQKDKVMVECSEENYKFDYYIVGARTDETLEVVQDG